MKRVCKTFAPLAQVCWMQACYAATLVVVQLVRKLLCSVISCPRAIPEIIKYDGGHQLPQSHPTRQSSSLVCMPHSLLGPVGSNLDESCPNMRSIILMHCYYPVGLSRVIQGHYQIRQPLGFVFSLGVVAAVHAGALSRIFFSVAFIISRVIFPLSISTVPFTDSCVFSVSIG